MRIYRVACLFWILMGSVATAQAQDWALDMFHRQTTHNFGTVARGAKAEYAFVVENIYKEDAHIASATSSCGCTRPSVTNNYIRTWQKAAVICSIDTTNFNGHREAAVTVRFDRPFPAEVILHVSVSIRSDVVVQPGEIDFGSVSQGARPSRRVTISYAGLPNWEIATIETSNRFLDIHAIETSRTAQQVTYDLTVSLKENTPTGYLRDQLILVTNDANPFNSRVPVPLEGIIVPSISVRPSPLLMGVANAGQTVTKMLVVQGHIPFRVVSVHCSDPRFKFRTPGAAQSLQLIPVTFVAGDVTGAVEQVIRIETDNAAKAVMDVPVQVRVLPGATVQAETPAPSPTLPQPTVESNPSLPPDEPKTAATPKAAPAPKAAADKPWVPAAETPAPPPAPVVTSAPESQKNHPSQEASAPESEPSGPVLADPGQPVKKPALQIPWANLLTTPDGPAAPIAARDSANAELPPSPSPATPTPPAEPPAATKTTTPAADVAPAKPATPAVAVPAAVKTPPAKAPARVMSQPRTLPQTVTEAVPLHRPAFGPDGKPLPRTTVKVIPVHPPNKALPKPAPPKPDLPWDAPPPAKSLPKSAPQEK